MAALDPVRLDPRLPALCAANSAADLRSLIGLLSSLVEATPQPAAFSAYECLAVMRDLGIVMGSIKRHGAEPVEVVPSLEPLLLYLGERSGMVPRDTVHHYTGWNPGGVRERTYTGNRNETMLISAVRISLPRLNAGVEVCQHLSQLEPNDLDFVVAANELVVLLGSLETSADTATANVNPEFFARVLRPFYCDVRVGDHRYLGPSGAHVPLSLIDLALWASDHGAQRT